MANRQTGIGLLFRQDPEKARAELLVVAEAHRGNLTHMAEDLGIARRHLYRLVTRANLWVEVDQLREQRRLPSWLQTTMENLR